MMYAVGGSEFVSLSLNSRFCLRKLISGRRIKNAALNYSFHIWSEIGSRDSSGMLSATTGQIDLTVVFLELL